jgi:hypothetical protein
MELIYVKSKVADCVTMYIGGFTGDVNGLRLSSGASLKTTENSQEYI